MFKYFLSFHLIFMFFYRRFSAKTMCAVLQVLDLWQIINNVSLHSRVFEYASVGSFSLRNFNELYFLHCRRFHLRACNKSRKAMKHET